MKKLMTFTILSLLSISSLASVGEGSTECSKNQSTQARVSGKSKSVQDSSSKPSEKPAESTSRES
ncbi:hypothetical protein [Halobacteriovorax sp. JY17]|uniref:hypothetical protein n=1 Tax=Halobacteriovorax sp. JY17 TaxID=2014617 RepID=UPI000C5862A5|nr:hypothetical protein [Halobacteriovorax sp. JY17]PIK14531.1 MAG: hypothetical protein CES88_09305 [Halobacteriovorax sp. JY17]